MTRDGSAQGDARSDREVSGPAPGRTHYDVVIVGARVAGSTLAGLLGRKGLRVLLIDRAKFPSDALSTHVIYGDSFGVWEEMGAWPRIERIGAEPLAGIDWKRYRDTPDIRGMFMPLNGFPFGLCLRRILLDAALVETAAETGGVTLLTKTKVTDLVWDDGRVCGVRYEPRDSPTREATASARLVVGADGRFSFVARSVGAHEYNVVEPFHIAFYSYFRDVVPITPAMLEIIESEEAGGTIMLAPCDDDIWMIVLYAAQEEYGEFRQKHSALLWERLRKEPSLKDRLADAEMITRARGRGDLRNFTRVAAGPGWALVGDSGQHKDPIFGQGIGDAARTAWLLAGYVERAAAGDTSWSSALAEFNAYRDFDLIPNFDWMIKGCPRGVDRGDFREFFDALGADGELSERFVNIFSHAVSAGELFSAASIQRWKQRGSGKARAVAS